MDKKDVPYLVHESITTKLERTIEKLWILAIILIFLLVGTNCIWIYYESQWETISVEQENTDGINNYVGNDGDIYNGTTNDKNKTP